MVLAIEEIVDKKGIYLGGHRGAEKEKGIFLPFDFSANKGKDIALAYALSEQKMSYWGISCHCC